MYINSVPPGVCEVWDSKIETNFISLGDKSEARVGYRCLAHWG